MNNILFLSQVLPFPLDAGPKTRAYFVLRHLARSHRLSLLSFSRPDDTVEAINHLREFCHEVVTVPMPRSIWRDANSLGHSLISSQPFLITRDKVVEMEQIIKQMMVDHPYDWIHADQLWMVQYALKAKEFAKQVGRNSRVLLDQHNAVYLIPKRLLFFAKNPLWKYFLKRESHMLADYEGRICRLCDHVVWVTHEDQKAVEKVEGGCSSNSEIIPICVNPSEIQPIIKLTKEPNILFLGGMHWPPNAEGVRWFVSEVFPIIKSEIPEVQLNIVGKSPPIEIMNIKGVITTGFVKDISPYWRDGRVFIVPIHAAGGMRVKILDAWMHGLPVISTSIGAEGIKYQDGTNIQIADDPEYFAQCVIQVIQVDLLAHKLSALGRTAVETHYDWEKVYRLWDEVYQ